MIFKLRTPQEKANIIGYIERLPYKPYLVKIELIKQKRSIAQNSLYWLWLTCIEQEGSNNRDELSEYFKAKYLLPTEVTVRGETVLIRPSTTKLDTQQFTVYLEKIKQFALDELGVLLPEPSEQGFNEFYLTYINI